MNKNHDKYYARTRHDTYRVCRKCNKEYKQWSRLQDQEAWTRCQKCALRWNPSKQG